MKKFILFIVLVLFTIGCSSSPKHLHHTASDNVKSVRWHPYSNILIKTAHYAKSPILLYFTSPDCPACIKMDKETFVSPDVVGVINESYIPILVKDTDDELFLLVAKKYGAMKNDAVIVPTIIILSSANPPELITETFGFVDALSLTTRLQAAARLDALLRVMSEVDGLFDLPIGAE